MIEVIADRTQTAKKRHRCDGCCGTIEPGQLYHVQFNKNDGAQCTYREHEWCRRASILVAAEMDTADFMDGMPRPCDMEEEDRAYVQEELPEDYERIWGMIDKKGGDDEQGQRS